MKIIDTASVVKNAIAQSIGDSYMDIDTSNISAIESFKIADVGEEVINSGSIEKFTKALITQLGKMVIDEKKYKYYSKIFREKIKKGEKPDYETCIKAIIYDYTPKQNPSPKVFKKLHYQTGAVFGNKLFTLEMLDSNRDYLPANFCIPDSLVTVGGVVQGFTLPKVEGKNLTDILNDPKETTENKI